MQINSETKDKAVGFVREFLCWIHSRQNKDRFYLRVSIVPYNRGESALKIYASDNHSLKGLFFRGGEIAISSQYVSPLEMQEYAEQKWAEIQRGNFACCEHIYRLF